MWSRLPKPAAIADACGRAIRRSIPAAVVVLAACALGGGAWAGHRWLTRSPRFAITAITIQGTQRLDPAELRATLPLHLGDNVFVALGEVARAVRANPWIASADVRRVLPHTIAIEVREHQAVAVVELGDLYLVDADGLPFKRAEAEEGDGLPTISGLDRAAYVASPGAVAATVRDAIAAAERWRTADRPAIDEIHVDPHGALTLHTRDQAIAIRLGALGPELTDRMHTFDAAWAGLSDAERAHTRAIHLDARPDHVTVALAKD